MRETPEWPWVELRRMASVVTTKATEKSFELGLEDIESWTGRLLTAESTYEAAGVAFEKGDVLFGKLRPYLAKVYQAEQRGQAVGDFIVLRPGRNVHSRFLTYNLLEQRLIERLTAGAYGSKMPRTNWDDLGSQPIWLPPFEEQRRIAAFLDHETARIDELVREQERLRELIFEKRRALIVDLVTQGVVASGARIASRVPWIPYVPCHWRTLKLSYAFRTIGSGTTPPSASDQWYGGDTPWVTTGELRENVILDTQKHVSDSALAAFPTLKRYPAGSIVIAMYGATIGRVAVLGVPATVNQACCVLAQPTALNSEFVFYWLQAFREDVARLGVGGGQPNISQEIVSNLRIPAPSLVEQAEIVHQLRQRIHEFDDLLSATQQGIEVLRERRSALISAAVTGQLDLRNWESPEREAIVEEVA